MLRELSIKNAAIIEEQTISFTPGLNVLSGETGGGKSIVLSCIEFLLGAKPKPNFIRTGADELEVQAIFDISALDSKSWIELPDLAKQTELAISRSLSPNGRSKIFINGKLSTLATLSEVAQKLISICGQHQHVRLLDSKFHLELLDGYANCQSQTQKFSENFKKWRDLQITLEKLTKDQQGLALRQAQLEFLVTELEAVNLQVGIRNKLDNEIRKFSQSENILKLGQAFEESLDCPEGLYNSLANSTTQLVELTRLNPDLAACLDTWRDIRAQLEETDAEIRRTVSKTECDPGKLDELRNQLAEVARLERKYKLDDTSLIKLLADSKQELANMHKEDDLAKIQEQAKSAYEDCLQLAGTLSKLRHKFAKDLSLQAKVELKEVGMNAELSAKIENCELCSSGSDKVEFLLLSNKGERALPLRQIASGGELSRIMLVLKKILRERSGVNVLVFDEVDSGISGSVARAVGQKLKELAKHSQVICITHLPQVASLADHHLLVEKSVGKRTYSSIRVLNAEQRVKEIARMLAGYEITAATLESARELVSSNFSSKPTSK